MNGFVLASDMRRVILSAVNRHAISKDNYMTYITFVQCLRHTLDDIEDVAKFMGYLDLKRQLPKRLREQLTP